MSVCFCWRSEGLCFPPLKDSPATNLSASLLVCQSTGVGRWSTGVDLVYQSTSRLPVDRGVVHQSTSLTVRQPTRRTHARHSLQGILGLGQGFQVAVVPEGPENSQTPTIPRGLEGVRGRGGVSVGTSVGRIFQVSRPKHTVPQTLDCPQSGIQNKKS